MDVVERFLCTEAARVGVVRTVLRKVPANPNKRDKTLAPWFDEECRAAKRAY